MSSTLDRVGRDAPAPTISVAFSTYNGAAFLAEQFARVAAQTRAPDELVDCDDGSSDDSAGVVSAFARAARVPVVLRLVAAGLGSTKIADRAISLAPGHIIPPADQNDVWRPDHPARLVRVLARSGVAVPSPTRVLRTRPGTCCWDVSGCLGDALDRLRARADAIIDAGRPDELSAAVARFERRATLPRRHAASRPLVRRELAVGGYHRLGSGVTSAPRDCYR